MTHLGRSIVGLLFIFSSALSFGGEGDFPNQVTPVPQEKYDFSEQLQRLENEAEEERRQELSEKYAEQDRKRRMKACFKNDKIEYFKILKKIRLLLKPIQMKAQSRGGLERLVRAGVHLNKLIEIHTQIDCENPRKQDELARLLTSIKDDLQSFQKSEIKGHDQISGDRLVDALQLSQLDPKVIDLILEVKDRKLSFKTYGFHAGLGLGLGAGVGGSAGLARTAYGDAYTAYVPQAVAEVMAGIQISVGRYVFKGRNLNVVRTGGVPLRKDPDVMKKNSSGAMIIGGTYLKRNEKKFYEGTLAYCGVLIRSFGMVGIKLFPVKHGTSSFLKSLGLTWKNIRLDTQEP